MESALKTSLTPFREGVLQASGRMALSIDQQAIQDVIDLAYVSPKKRARIVMHENDDSPMQEMLICMLRETELPIHKHLNKEESYFLIQGEMVITLYGDGKHGPEWFDELILNKESPYARVKAGAWHHPKIKSDYVVILETTQGPWRKEDTRNWEVC
jgi:cupin fold WbuC family metalloprotein